MGTTILLYQISPDCQVLFCRSLAAEADPLLIQGPYMVPEVLVGEPQFLSDRRLKQGLAGVLLEDPSLISAS